MCVLLTFDAGKPLPGCQPCGAPASDQHPFFFLRIFLSVGFLNPVPASEVRRIFRDGTPVRLGCGHHGHRLLCGTPAKWWLDTCRPGGDSGLA